MEHLKLKFLANIFIIFDVLSIAIYQILGFLNI